MTSPTAGSPESDVTFYDAEEQMQASRRCATVHRRRVSTDFPECDASKPVGPWRTTEVEGHNHASWLLIGRRHSVDERRDALEQGKTLFLRVLAARADGSWRQRTAARADEIQAVEERVNEQLEQQARSLQEAGDFWCERCRADRAYLERLEASAPAVSRGALPASQARQVTDWRRGVQRAAESSAAWAEQLPHLIERHKQAAAEVQRSAARATAEAEAACGCLRSARSAVWPTASRAGGKLPGTHSCDVGPDVACLWQAVRKYLAACENLQSAQCVTLARLRRDERRLVRLGEWVARVLSASGETTPSSPSTLVDLAPEEGEEERLKLPRAGRRREADAGQASDDGEEEDEDSDEALDMSTDISALVIHEQEVEVRHGAEAAEAAAWAPARLLLSVDLWLHVWTPAELPREGEPSESLLLARACLRPVAVRVDGEPCTLRLMMRPQAAPGLLERLSARLWSAPEKAPGELLIRCAGEAACTELLACLELVEKLYPTLE